MTVVEKVYRFYRHECCYPYSVSFLLVLCIYAVDFFFSDPPMLWPSLTAYLIIAGYYIQNIRFYKRNRLNSENPEFFILLLTVKIVVWGFLLSGLLIFT
jgi:hypothetical protein